jgi:hypothetical protein
MKKQWINLFVTAIIFYGFGFFSHYSIINWKYLGFNPYFPDEPRVLIPRIHPLQFTSYQLKIKVYSFLNEGKLECPKEIIQLMIDSDVAQLMEIYKEISKLDEPQAQALLNGILKIYKFREKHPKKNEVLNLSGPPVTKFNNEIDVFLKEVYEKFQNEQIEPLKS